MVPSILEAGMILIVRPQVGPGLCRGPFDIGGGDDLNSTAPGWAWPLSGL